MCFSLPQKVTSVHENTAITESGDKVRLGHDVRTKPGHYLLVTGNIAVRSLTPGAGEKILRMIAGLQENYAG